jgi:hypothetical protein
MQNSIPSGSTKSEKQDLPLEKIQQGGNRGSSTDHRSITKHALRFTARKKEEGPMTEFCEWLAEHQMGTAPAKFNGDTSSM